MSDQPTTTCPNCGGTTPPGATFCPTCGGALSPAQWQQPRPPAAASAQESRTWAIGAHASALVGALLGGLPAFVGPLVVWLVRRENDPHAADHGREALNFNLTVLLIVFVGILLGVVTIGLGFIIIGPLLLVFGVLWLVWTVQGIIAAANDQPYRYPMTIRFIKA